MAHSVLHRGLIEAARRFPDRPAVEEPGRPGPDLCRARSVVRRMRDRLVAMGVVPGDRVGFYLRKSIDTVATLYGILKTGAAHAG